MNLFPRLTCFSLAFTALACGTDPGDVGSESATLSGSAEDSATADDAASADDDDDDGGSTAASDGATETGSPGDGEGTSDASASDGSETGAPTSEDGGGSSSEGDSGDGGTMVADCSECGPDEGCVSEVAFTTAHFCVPIPEACGLEFTCDCAGEFCVDPFTVCYDPPDPPQRAIVCECPNC